MVAAPLDAGTAQAVAAGSPVPVPNNMLQQQQQQHEQVVPTFDLHPQAMKQAQKELSHAKKSIASLENDQSHSLLSPVPLVVRPAYSETHQPQMPYHLLQSCWSHRERGKSHLLKCSRVLSYWVFLSPCPVHRSTSRRALLPRAARSLRGRPDERRGLAWRPT